MPCANYAIAPTKVRKAIMAGETKALAQFAAGLHATKTFRRRPSPSPRPASSIPSASCCSGLDAAVEPDRRRLRPSRRRRFLYGARPGLPARERAGRGLRQRCLRASRRVRQPAAAVDRRASRRHRADRQCLGGPAEEAKVSGKDFDHRLRRRPGMHVPVLRLPPKSSLRAKSSAFMRPASPACSARRSRPARS